MTARADSPAPSTPEYIRAAAEFAARFSFGTTDPAIVGQSLTIVRDTIGCIIAGSGLPELRGLRLSAAALAGPGNASAVGVSDGVAPQAAAMINAMAGVSLELDEGCQFSANHPAVHILPAALAVAEANTRTGAEFLAAFVAGYEVACWFGHRARLRDHVHPFGTHAIIGAATAATKLSGADANGIAAAIELSAGMALASSQTAANAGASVRNAVTGLTAFNATLVPVLLKAGVTPEPNAVATVFGKILGQTFTPPTPSEQIGRDPYLLKNYFKIHACSRWNHAPIEAAAAAMAARAFSPDDVLQATVWTFDPATRLSWTEPNNSFAAKHSIPFNVAIRLCKGSNDFETYCRRVVEDPVVRELAARIEVREDPAYTRVAPAIRPARVDVRLRDGTTVTGECRSPLGGFDNPFGDGVLNSKFRRLAGLGLTATDVDQLDRCVCELKTAASVVPIGRLLRAATAVLPT